MFSGNIYFWKMSKIIVIIICTYKQSITKTRCVTHISALMEKWIFIEKFLFGKVQWKFCFILNLLDICILIFFTFINAALYDMLESEKEELWRLLHFHWNVDWTSLKWILLAKNHFSKSAKTVLRTLLWWRWLRVWKSCISFANSWHNSCR